MALDPRLVDMLGDTITIAPTTGLSRDGSRALGVAVSYAAHVMYKQVAIVAPTGRTVQSSGRCYLAVVLPSTIDTYSQLTLPGGETPNILLITTYHDDSGPYCSVVHFGNG